MAVAISLQKTQACGVTPVHYIALPGRQMPTHRLSISVRWHAPLAWTHGPLPVWWRGWRCVAGWCASPRRMASAGTTPAWREQPGRCRPSFRPKRGGLSQCQQRTAKRSRGCCQPGHPKQQPEPRADQRKRLSACESDGECDATPGQAAPRRQFSRAHHPLLVHDGLAGLLADSAVP